MKLRYYQKIFIIALFCSGLAVSATAQTTEKIDSVKQGQTPEYRVEKTARYIGYDKQDSLFVTGSISTVKGDELLKQFNPRISNKLYGRLSGLTVMQGNSEPGTESAGLRARGINSYQNGSIVDFTPLVVIDGFLGTMEQLVAEEIEEISLLKDASATAIYGMRGANGVLLVTTKRGKQGPLAIGFSSQWGFSNAIALPKTLSSYQYAQLRNEAYDADGVSNSPVIRYTDDDLEAYRTGIDPVFHPDVNWYDEILRKSAPLSNYNLNFRGGDKTVNYFVLLNAINSQGLFKNFGKDNPESRNSIYSRYNFRANVEVNVTKRFSATLLLGGSVEDKANPFEYTAGSVFGTLANLPSNAFPVFVPEGTEYQDPFQNTAIVPSGSYARTKAFSNPLANLTSAGYSESNARTIQSSFQLKHELDFITPGLSASAAVSFNNNFVSGSAKRKDVLTYDLNPSGQYRFTPSLTDPNPFLSGQEDYLGQYRTFAIQGFLNYKRTFGIHDIAALVMYNTDNNNINRFQPTATAANNALPYKSNGGGSRITYVNNRKYIAEFSLGVMGTENFPKGNRYGYFPAGSIGWIASNESFLKDNKTLTFLKLRASYGLTGNESIGGRFLYETRYPNTDSYYFGNGAPTTVAGITTGRVPNMNVTWEKDKKANIGFEAGLFNQVRLAVEVFNNDRYDILHAIDNDGGITNLSSGTIPAFLGYTDAQMPLLNQGKVNSKGFETTLGYTSKQKGSFSFFADANISYYKNKILQFGEAYQINSGLRRTGTEIGTPFGLVALGLFQTQEDVNASAKPVGATVRVGDIKYADLGGPDGIPDGVIDGNDAKPIGNPSMPNMTVGLHTGLKFKGFDLDLMFQGVTGRTVYLGGAYFQAFSNTNYSAFANALDRWTPETPNATFPRLSLQATTNAQNNYLFSSFYQRNGDFIKLRAAEIGYTLPGMLMSKVSLKSGRVFINGTNLFSIDNIKYGDPESLGSGYPSLRTYSLGLRVGF